jgi:hypothetical protein
VTFRSKYAALTIVCPAAISAATYLFLTGRRGSESDWLGVAFLLPLAVGALLAGVSAVVLSIISYRRDEPLCGLALVTSLGLAIGVGLLLFG